MSGIEPFFAALTRDDRERFWSRIFAPPQPSPESEVWARVLVVAREAVDLFPPDTKTSLHRFGAETVLRALMKAALKECEP